MRYTRNFTRAEFLVSSGHPHLVRQPTPVQDVRLAFGARLLQRIRDQIGAPITITSGLRSPELTAALGGSSSPDGHQGGYAADIVAHGWRNEDLIQVVYDLHRAGELLGLDQAITYTFTRHVHLGWGPRARGQFLRAYRPQGSRTLYEPWSPA